MYMYHSILPMNIIFAIVICSEDHITKLIFLPFFLSHSPFLPCLSFLFFLLLVIWQSVISEPQDARLKLDLPFIPFSSDRVYYYQLGSHMILCCSCCWSNSLNRRNAQNTISSSNKVSSSKQ